MKKKRIIALVATVVLSFSMLAGCGNKATTDTTTTKEKTKVGMVTDSGTIDDRSFNQGTWEGIKKYAADKGTTETKYLQPTGEQEADYINAINDLVDSGYKIIVCPGFKFETAVNKAAVDHADVTFILIDGTTHEANKFDFVKHDNVVCVLFQENEAGFLAGVSAALSTKTGKLGFIGGMEIPPVQRYGWGYQAGVKYANDNLGAKAKITKYVYQGTFNEIAAGQTLASGMYSDGIDVIFQAAGGVGVGVFNEAKQRAEKGEKVYVVGVDVDQYDLGKIADGTSVALTSALKRIDVAGYDYIDAKLNNKFPGGQIITRTVADGGLGLPLENKNLSEDVKAKVKKVQDDITSGTIKVPATQEELDAFLK